MVMIKAPFLGLFCLLPHLLSAAPVAEFTLSSTTSLEKRALPIDTTRTAIVGYRRCSPDLAKKYNDGHKLVFDMAFRDEKKSRDQLLEQLGPGVYTTPDDTWPGAPRDWQCVIRADPAKLNAMKKIWIPEENDCGQDLWDEDDAIVEHIQRNNLDPDKTLRLSHVIGKPILQALIPPKAIADLDARVDCYAPDDPALAGIPKTAVDYDTWSNVINRADKDKNEAEESFGYDDYLSL